MGEKLVFLVAEKDDDCNELLIRPKGKIMPIQANNEETEEEEKEEEKEESEDKNDLSRDMATEDEEDTEEGEEGRKAVGAKIPQKVSKEERQTHELTHTHPIERGVHTVLEAEERIEHIKRAKSTKMKLMSPEWPWTIST